MRLTLDQARDRFADRPRPAPREHVGEWVAWCQDRTRIVAHGKEFAEVRAEAMAAGYPEPLMQRVLDTPFVGGA